MRQFNHQPLIIAHRGAGFGEEENGLKAYQRALKMGVDGIEMDLRMTADGVVVCHHDRGVWEVGEVGGVREKKRYWIDKISWEELKKIKKVVKFEEVVKNLMVDDRRWKLNQTSNFQPQDPTSTFYHLSSIILDLDLKQEGMEREIVRILKKYKIKKVMVNSTNVWTLKSFEDVYPQAKLALSYHPADPRDLANHKAIRFLALLTYYSLKPLLFRLIRRKTAIGDIQVASLNYRLVSKKVVQFLHQYNIKVFVWGTEEERKLRWLVDLGVDGIKTRKPDLLKQIIMINS